MSTSRLLLRSLACVALQQQADDAVSPTMAEKLVFDSRLNPLQFTDGDNDIPCVVVYTDDDNGTLINRGGGTAGPYERIIDLRVEIAVGSFGKVAENDDGYGFAIPMTDPQLEAQLDLFEAQVRWALMSIPNRKYTNAFLAYVKRIETIQSHATRDESGNNKFAQRRIHFACVVNDDCPPFAKILLPGEKPPKPLDISFKDFPSPWLRDVLEVMKNTPSIRNVLDQLSGAGNPYAYVPLLKRIGFNVDAIEPEADPNLLAAQGKTHGPDGRIEVKNILELP